MPQPNTLKISEIFCSVQGEGLRMGDPTLFVRLSGCNRRCHFCDTKAAWSGGRSLTPGDILSRVKKMRKRFPASWVCLTGGEPMLQDIAPLVRLLKSEGLSIQVETNGTLFRPIEVDWMTVSPKPEDYKVRPELVPLAREVKMLVTEDLNLQTLKKMRLDFMPPTPILLQPLSQRIWSREKAWALLSEGLRAGLANIRLSLQLHKIYRLK